MARSTATQYELELRFGMRQIRSIQFGLVIFSTICSIGHTVSTILLVVAAVFGFAQRNQVSVLEGISVFFVLFALLFNRPAMYFALKMLTAIESAIIQCRERQDRGWIGRFMELFPLSLFIPPGDLLAVVLLLLRIRVHTDHLNRRQISIFKWCEVGFGFGSAAQYASFAIWIASMLTAQLANASLLYAIAIGCQVLMIAGILSVAWASTTMCRELLEVIRQAHWEQDPAELFLATLDVGDPPTIVGLAAESSSTEVTSH
ncbi:MAG: hypothetical protein WCJ09_11955 [Planctomycetota bacterium]